ncbi:unnamed protein product, partial [Bubo scandiacus]
PSRRPRAVRGARSPAPSRCGRGGPRRPRGSRRRSTGRARAAPRLSWRGEQGAAPRPGGRLPRGAGPGCPLCDAGGAPAGEGSPTLRNGP